MPHSGFVSTPWEPLAGALTVGYNCRVCATRTMLVSTHSTRMLNQETISPCSQKPQKKGASTCQLRGKDTEHPLTPTEPRAAPTSCRLFLILYCILGDQCHLPPQHHILIAAELLHHDVIYIHWPPIPRHHTNQNRAQWCTNTIHKII